MKSALTPLLLCSVFALAACNAPAPTAEDTAKTETPVPVPAPTDVATPPINPAPQEPAMPPSTTPDSGSVAKWDGYDTAKFGMSEAELRKASRGELKADTPAKGSDCYHLAPAGAKTQAEFALMFEEGKFVRYSAESDTLIAPGGGKVGMSRAEIDKLYAGKIEEQLHKYTDGKYLRIKNGANLLIFETDAAGKVTEWRVGVPPQVDYVEGCA